MTTISSPSKSTDTVIGYETPVKSKKVNPQKTPNTDQKAQKIITTLFGSPSEKLHIDREGKSSIRQVVLDENPFDTLSKYASKKRPKSCLDSVHTQDSEQEDLSYSIKKLREISSSSRNLPPLQINKARLEYDRKTNLSKKDCLIMRLRLQLIFMNRLDEYFNSLSYQCVDTDHVIHGEVKKKGTPSGMHFIAGNPNITVIGQITFKDLVEVAKWGDLSKSEKTKNSTCFSKHFFCADDELGMSFDEADENYFDNIKTSLLSVFERSNDTSFRRPSSIGESFLKTYTVNRTTIYIECLKENARSHTVNTMYPVVLFEQAEILASDPILIGCNKLYSSELSDVQIYLDRETFFSIFKFAIEKFISHITSGNPIKMKTPVRYFSSEKDTYIVDGASGLDILDHSHDYWKQLFSEGFLAEFSSFDLDYMIKRINPALDASTLFNTLPEFGKPKPKDIFLDT